MDLTIKLEKSTLNIRVAIILNSENGFVLEKNKAGTFHHFVGGRIKEGESSLVAAKRELEEETGLIISNLEFISAIENFFGPENDKVQEICFVYYAETQKKIDSKYNLLEIKKEQFESMDIRPKMIVDLILEDKLTEITHFII